MNRAECRAALTQLLKRHNRCIEDAIGYLDEIKQAFAENRLEGMQALLETPRFDLSEIDALESERHRLLADSGFNGGDRGMRDCVDWCDDAEQSLSTRYLELVDRLKSLQRSIQVNSLLVSQGRDRVRRSIGVLTGARAPEVKTYSSDGRTVDGGSRRNLAIA